MTDDKPESFSFCRVHYPGQPPETPEMTEKYNRATLEYTETGKISPDLPDLLVEESDGHYRSVKETTQQRISGLSGLLADVLETMPDGVSAAKLRLAVRLLDDLPRLINRETQR
jgi:hypothetical protein